MDRESVVKISKNIKFGRHTISDYNTLIVEYCKECNKENYISELLPLLSIPFTNNQIISYILDYYEHKYNIIFITYNNKLLNIF